MLKIATAANASAQPTTVEAAGLFKGSIYHYFANKDLLLIAAIMKIHRHFDEHIFCLAYDDAKSQSAKMKTFAKAIYEFFEHRECGCLMGNVLLEIPQGGSEIQSVIKGYFDDWAKAFAAILGKDKASESLAKEWVGNIQGALLIEKIYPSDKILRKTLDKIIAEFEQRISDEK